MYKLLNCLLLVFGVQACLAQTEVGSFDTKLSGKSFMEFVVGGDVFGRETVVFENNDHFNLVITDKNLISSFKIDTSYNLLNQSYLKKPLVKHLERPIGQFVTKEGKIIIYSDKLRLNYGYILIDSAGNLEEFDELFFEEIDNRSESYIGSYQQNNTYFIVSKSHEGKNTFLHFYQFTSKNSWAKKSLLIDSQSETKKILKETSRNPVSRYVSEFHLINQGSTLDLRKASSNFKIYSNGLENILLTIDFKNKTNFYKINLQNVSVSKTVFEIPQAQSFYSVSSHYYDGNLFQANSNYHTFRLWVTDITEGTRPELIHQFTDNAAITFKNSPIFHHTKKSLNHINNPKELLRKMNNNNLLLGIDYADDNELSLIIGSYGIKELVLPSGGGIIAGGGIRMHQSEEFNYFNGIIDKKTYTHNGLSTRKFKFFKLDQLKSEKHQHKAEIAFMLGQSVHLGYYNKKNKRFLLYKVD